MFDPISKITFIKVVFVGMFKVESIRNRNPMCSEWFCDSANKMYDICNGILINVVLGMTYQRVLLSFSGLRILSDS